MSNENRKKKRTRPDINKSERYDDVDIDFNRDAELEEDTYYTGTIEKCSILKNEKGQSFVLTIVLDDDEGEFTSFHQCPIHRYSPIRNLLVAFEKEFACCI